MYRTTVGGKEIIVKLATKLAKGLEDRTPVYEAVLSVAPRVLSRPEQTSFAVHSNMGLIIGEVHRGEIVVFSVEHIIEKQNIFQQLLEQTFERGANF
ncbi:MAG: cytoplasmic protein [Ectobacillus sp.]